VKVHIVTRLDNHVVPRMGQWLVDEHGWTMGEAVDPRADVNYFMPYLWWTLKENPPTATAAWFTHFESGTRWKVEKWQDAACFIDMPLVTAPMYYTMLDRAQSIAPGVDTDLFRPFTVHHERSDAPLVGTAGIGQPRKGPRLLVDLFYSGVRVDLRVVGANWPFPHTFIADYLMPTFYNMLDVYLCTSLEEGVPEPVLEALACDTPVVVPDGVGICDQLPEMEGIRHYKRGDSGDMVRALRLALDDRPPSGLLREVVMGQYTIDDWCASHLAAMEMLLDAELFV
jgi:glycosyltransferase involved in cell wall biosynthesis